MKCISWFNLYLTYSILFSILTPLLYTLYIYSLPEIFLCKAVFWACNLLISSSRWSVSAGLTCTSPTLLCSVSLHLFSIYIVYLRYSSVMLHFELAVSWSHLPGEVYQLVSLVPHLLYSVQYPYISSLYIKLPEIFLCNAVFWAWSLLISSSRWSVSAGFTCTSPTLLCSVSLHLFSIYIVYLRYSSVMLYSELEVSWSHLPGEVYQLVSLVPRLLYSAQYPYISSLALH